jgi:glycosyltransferase involved in cell wall biosynthesis
MRILYVHNINQVAETYGADLTRRGHFVKVYEPSLVGGSAPLPIKLAMMPGRVLGLHSIASALNPKHFEIAHIHWASYGVLGLVSRIPFIVQCHGSDVRHRLKQPFFRTVLTSIFRRAAAVMCITPDILPLVQSIRPDAMFFPAPIDTEQFSPRKVPQPQSWTILLLARLDPVKGVDVSTQGIARFVQRHPDVRVMVLDCGPLREKYKQLYSERFEFIPPVAQEEVRQLIWPADVIVGQFALGALGLSELQAMSCGKPVIASFRYEEAYATPPPLCQARNAEEIEVQLENLFQHPEVAKELGQKAREWVINYHNHQMLAVRLETLYQTILNERKGELNSTSQLLA